MADLDSTNSPIIAAYREKTPASERLAAEAAEVFPSGITHDSRYLPPYGIYVGRAEGARKWDADGNEYLDYFGGHGALLLGHNHPRCSRRSGTPWPMAPTSARATPWSCAGGNSCRG